MGGEPGLFCDDPDCCRFIGLALMRAKIGLPLNVFTSSLRYWYAF